VARLPGGLLAADVLEQVAQRERVLVAVGGCDGYDEKAIAHPVWVPAIEATINL
jgi:hypothetical protein